MQWRRGRLTIGCALLLLCAAVQAQDPAASSQAAPLPAVIAAIDDGHFQQASARIDAALQQDDLSASTRQALQFQRERMRRMRIDFALDRNQVMARIRQQIPDLSDAEFDRWDAAGTIEHLDIDGSRFYFNRSASNLYRVNPEAAARRAPPVKPNSDGPFEHLHPHHSEALQQALQTGATSVAPRRLQVTQSLTVDADAVPAGETIRAWIPYPRAIPGQQEDIQLVASQPDNARIAPETTLQRTAYLEKKAQAGQPTEFSVTYELTIHARYFDIDPEKVVAAPLTDELTPYVQERPPHIVFTDAIKAYSLKVVGAETNPYRIVQKLFAAVDKTPWAGAREYSTISNISDYALHAGHADCGQQTLLLMTLLRYNGIPTRWQSGWTYSDESVGYDNMHDWGWVYLAPYGWVPMDVTTGQLDSDNPKLRWFYLGGLDAYRITFNDDFSRELVPAKQHFRSETVDSQRGEAEWRGGNLYFDQWDYDFKWKMLPVKSSSE
ncbi:transglutaminase-like domain-containing protein [Pseudoxanthomonas dokdonensis]|uniref:Transglutaminase n=1 Tax=Pseudoxanthomonas dokdonensis TaxID=344882 RepID=A0A0R0D0I0_9GAMM|nr:transglutaminase-like domain-containing protein [Pseudoxanthomonas dokdonensis]KRG71966.1 transglutaminase [Pseudoxanthomonas dokdonensis]